MYIELLEEIKNCNSVEIQVRCGGFLKA